MLLGKRFLGFVFILLGAVAVSPLSVDAGLNPFAALHNLLFGGKKVSAEDIARSIDQIEKYLDTYGTVAVKQPDVWGDARLTASRQEFETRMKERIDKFEYRLSGSQSISDSALFAQALSAAGGQATAESFADVRALIPDPNASGQDILIRTKTPVAASAIRELFGGDRPLIGIEPHRELEQRRTYLDRNHELRRVNEGDDTSSSPGYALNLIRVPVSINSGRFTKKGFGAVANLAVYPDLDQRLLPTTFRNLVINDLVDQFGVPIWAVREWVDKFNDEKKRIQKAEEDKKKAKQNYIKIGRLAIAAEDRKTIAEIKEEYPLEFLTESNFYSRLDNSISNLPQTASPEVTSAFEQVKEAREEAQRQEQQSADEIKEASEGIEQISSEIENALNKLLGSSTRQRRAKMSIPPSQVVEVFGFNQLMAAAGAVYDSRLGNGDSQILDIQTVLQEEFDAAYEMLTIPQYSTLNGLTVWDEVLGKECLALHIRGGDVPKVQEVRQKFFRMMQKGREGLPETSWPPIEGEKYEPSIETNPKVVDSLAWAILVESALLNERLIQDMQDRGMGYLTQPRKNFYGPYPPLEACNAFNEYVRRRWPIHVFALDPNTEEQNIADMFARRREMQMTLSLAFANGKMSARSLTRYARRLEWDMDTIALNQTSVGFADGPDSFGWKFFPRFQTPPIESNMKVLFRDLIRGGPTRDEDRRHWEIEGGMRECNAIVLMPSFIPSLTVEVRTNWLHLNDPSCNAMTVEDSMEMSRFINAVKTSSLFVGDWQYYRPEDQQTLRRRLDQLMSRLPLQSYTVQVPFENTAGGFEMFSTGITELAPELVGFTGEPGFRKGEETTVFLVGDNFNIHANQVVAGNRPIKEAKLLSRQVMQITIDKGAETLEEKDGAEYVDVHVASPYGVSRHIQIPAFEAEKKDEKSTELKIAWDEPGRTTLGVIGYSLDPNTMGNAVFDFIQPAPDKVTLKMTNAPKLSPLSASIELSLWINNKNGEMKDLKISLSWPKTITFSEKGECYIDFATRDKKGVDRPYSLEKSIKEAIEKGIKINHQAKRALIKGVLNFEKPQGFPVLDISNALEVEFMDHPKPELLRAAVVNVGVVQTNSTESSGE